MKKRIIFKGIGTALVTPFRQGRIDYPTLDRLIERQISGGVDALIIGGTTGEAATLSDRERYSLYTHAIEKIKRRCKVILGTGTNDTRVAIKHTKEAERLGADGALLVTPYYNKGTASGLAAHYEAIAASSDIPMILYNVPSRTGVNLGLPELVRLAKLDNIVGIKEASDSAERLVKLASFGDELPLYAGNDSATYTVLSLGGAGVISVVSNLLPEAMREISDAYFAGRTDESLSAQLALLDLIDAMFVETNPAPVKYALSRLGLCREEMRLPMHEITGLSREKVDRALAKICI
ncbi:MAG: 4-hydroxy-tetrahydrodipicolinate synthase [Clostridia bacterium]|nr:4-hydroxy-tetrahydrodipicolinate synthase [Clostridia bacterium]